MRNGKYNKSNKGSRAIVLLMALMLLVGSAIGGTLAWLISYTEPVSDTFTYGDVSIALYEGETATVWSAAANGINDTGKLLMVPGGTIGFDPRVEVTANSEDCYVYVKVDPSENAANFITHNMASGWTEITNADNNNGKDYKVYHRTVSKNATNPQRFKIIAGTTEADGGIVSVKSTVTKTMLDGVKNNLPTVAITAYAIQKNYLTDSNNNEVTTPEGAWTILNTNLPTNNG